MTTKTTLRPRTLVNWWSISATCLATVLCVTRPGYSQTQPPHQPVSLVSLIAGPETYDGKLVAVTGYAVFGWETSFLFLSPYDAQEFVSDNALWLDTAKSDKARAKKWRALFDHQTVTVEGTFFYPWKKKGEFGAGYPNGIVTNITDIRLQDVHPQLPGEAQKKE